MPENNNNVSHINHKKISLTSEIVNNSSLLNKFIYRTVTEENYERMFNIIFENKEHSKSKPSIALTDKQLQKVTEIGSITLTSEQKQLIYEQTLTIAQKK